MDWLTSLNWNPMSWFMLGFTVAFMLMFIYTQIALYIDRRRNPPKHVAPNQIGEVEDVKLTQEGLIVTGRVYPEYGHIFADDLQVSLRGSVPLTDRREAPNAESDTDASPDEGGRES